MNLRRCPKCGSDELDMDSSREMELSEITCLDCGHSLQRHLPENWLTVLWNIWPTWRKKSALERSKEEEK